MTSTTAPQAPEADLLKAAQADVASLARVSHRIALVDTTERLEQVLDKLLPRLLKRIGDNHRNKTQQSSSLTAAYDQIHTKLVQILSDVMKRVRNDTACRLPCAAILQLLVIPESAHDDNNDNSSSSIPVWNPHMDAMTTHLALAFLTLGVPRCYKGQLYELLPSLLAGQALRLGTPAQRSQSHQLAHLLLRCIEQLVVDGAHNNKITTAAGASTDPSAAAAAAADRIDASLAAARRVCLENPDIAGTVFDLLLDVLLYQPAAGSLPPAGLSQAGHERLKEGPSATATAKDWAAEMVPRQRRVQLKRAVLDFLAPSRKWALFLPNNTSSTTDATTKEQHERLGVARTMALLVVASGDDESLEVAERAKLLLKLHSDRLRGGGSTAATTGNASSSGGNDTNASTENRQDDSISRLLVGDPISFGCTLLSLCLGQMHAESIVASITQMHGDLTAKPLGATPLVNGLSNQVVLSTKRRPVSEPNLAAILSFVATKILQDDPLLFTPSQRQQTSDTGNIADSAGTKLSSKAVGIQCLATLAVQVAQNTLQSCSVSGLSTLRAKPYSSAAQLLNALSMRLSSYYDAVEHYSTNSSNDTLRSSSSSSMVHLMARILSTACTVLAPAATHRGVVTTTATTNDGNLAIRDSCYGVICTLARSQFAALQDGYIFTRGADNKKDNQQSTAVLLFGCAANEEERLRPRAIAALDSVLASYVRLYARETAANTTPPPNEAATPPPPSSSSPALENPWMNPTITPIDEATTAALSESPSIPTSRSSLLTALLPLVWTGAQSHKPKASRVAAARWASELLKELEITSACHILCFLAGDADSTAASLARQGLGLADLPISDENSIESSLEQLPDFGQLVNAMFARDSTTTATITLSSVRYQLYHDFSFKGKAVSLQFALVCLLSNFYGGTEESILTYLHALAESLGDFKTGIVGGGTAKAVQAVDLLDQCSSCLLSILGASQYARLRIVAGDCGFDFSNLKELTIHANSSRARRYLAGSCGKLMEDAKAWTLTGKDSLHELGQVLAQSAEILGDMEKGHTALSSLHGAAFLGAHAVRAMRLQAENWQELSSLEQCWKHAAQILESLGKGTLHQEEIIGDACSHSISIAFSYGGYDAPILNPCLYKASKSLLEKVTEATKKYTKTETLNVSRSMKAATAAGIALAATTTASQSMHDEKENGQSLGTVRLDCVDSLFDLLGSMAFRKQEEVALAAGEALACFADAYCPTEDVWQSHQIEWLDPYNEEFARGLPPHEHVLYVLIRREFTASSPQKHTAVAPALLAITARAARGVIGDESYARRAFVQSLLAHLEEVQATFITLLSDPKSKHLSRESCCLGLAACRGLLQSPTGDTGAPVQELNNRLLRAFGQTTNFGTSAMQETQSQALERRLAAGMEVDSQEADWDVVDSTSEVGGASGISEAALGAYREMASASAALGRHDVLYALLILSVSHSYWFTTEARHRYSATALFGDSSFVGSRTNALEMKNALRPHLGSLIPRILRAKHDPNSQTRDQMTSLWIGLTGGGAEARLAISLHLLPTIDALVEETSSRLWRVRVGSCGALAEIIVGRDWAALGGGGPTLNDDFLYTKVTSSASVRLLRLWRAAMRAMDDVRVTVRESGATLARAVRGLTIRLCDPASDETSPQAKRGRGGVASRDDTTAAAATALRWLVRHGLNQHAEGTGICVSTLVEVVGLVNAKILEPILPDLIRSLLLAISGLEPSVLSYLQLRTNDQESLERLRLQAAQQGPIAAAVNKCLELTPGAGKESQNRVVVELDAALRESPGFATRAATADAVGKLCSISPAAFQFEKSGSANPTVRLLRAFYYASEQERTSASRDRLIHALGSLAALSPGASVRSLVLKACRKYKRSTGNNDDPFSRRAAAAALRSIAVRASNMLTGEYSDVWCRHVLPVAFVGRKDADPTIASLWQEVWDEAGTAARSMGPTFGTTIEESLLEYLVTECTEALEDVAWARRVAGCRALIELCDMGILAPLKLLATDATASRSQHRAKCCKVALECCVQLVRKPRLWEGKTEAVRATSTLAGVWVAALVSEDISYLLSLGPESVIPISLSLSSQDDLFITDQGDDEEEMEEDASGDPDKKESEDEDFGESELEESHKALADNSVGSRPLSFMFLCRLLVEKAISRPQRDSGDLVLPYRKACFDSLSFLLTQLPSRRFETSLSLFKLIGPKLFHMTTKSEKEPPVLIAAALDCLGETFWYGIGGLDNASSTDESTPELRVMVERIAEHGGKTQPAWTVREASAKCLAQLVSKMNYECFREHELVSWVVDSAAYSLNDRKYWRVRYAALDLLQSLVQRAGSTASRRNGRGETKKEHAVVLEALLPHKEGILQLVRSCLRDSEAKITALSSEIIKDVAWWP